MPTRKVIAAAVTVPDHPAQLAVDGKLYRYRVPRQDGEQQKQSCTSLLLSLSRFTGRVALPSTFRVRLHHGRQYIGYDSGMEEADFTVRPGRRDDATAAARLWVRSAEEHTLYDTVYTTAPAAEKVMRRFLSDLSSSSHSCLFVAEVDEEVVGFLSGELREGSPAFQPKTWAAVEDVYVTPEHRSSGIGHALFEACQEWARERGANGVSLQVAADNTRGRKFYEELGFREVSVYQVKEF